MTQPPPYKVVHAIKGWEMNCDSYGEAVEKAERLSKQGKGECIIYKAISKLVPTSDGFALTQFKDE